MYHRILYLGLFISFLVTNQLFAVEKDSIYTINSYSNTLYLGIDNYIHISSEYFNESIYNVTTDNGIIFQDSSFFNLIPKRLPVANIMIYKYTEDDTLLVKKRKLPVKYVPKPCVLLNKKCIDEIKYINRNVLIDNPVLNIYISNDIKGSQQWMRIKRFTMGYVYGSVYKSFESENNTFTGEMMSELKQINVGQSISIKVCIESSGGMIQYLPVYNIAIF